MHGHRVAFPGVSGGSQESSRNLPRLESPAELTALNPVPPGPCENLAVPPGPCENLTVPPGGTTAARLLLVAHFLSANFTVCPLG